MYKPERAAYAKTEPDTTNIGTVTMHKRTIQVIDVTVTECIYVTDSEAEIVLRINGRMITRMNYHRAHRMGLIV